MKSPKYRIESFVLGTGAFVLSGAVLGMFLPTQDTVGGNPTIKFILAFVYLAVAIIALRRGAQVREVVSRNPALLAILILTCISALWSASPALSLQRSLAVTGASLLGVVLATRFTTEEQLCLLCRVFRFCAVLSIICMIVAPAVAFSADGAQGVFVQKNVMGDSMALAILTERYLPAADRSPRIPKLIWLCVYATLLVLSKSVTSIIAVCFTLSIIGAFTILRSHLRLRLISVILGIVLAASFVTTFLISGGSLFRLAGRSSDLTGRTELWGKVVGMILNRPLLGYGYSSFWGGASPESSDIAAEIGWTPAHSHNGYLETLLSLGLVGFVLLLIILARGFRRALVSAENGHATRDMWPLAFLVFFVVHNLGESTIISQNCLEWAICVAVIIGSDPRPIATIVEPSYGIESFGSQDYV